MSGSSFAQNQMQKYGWKKGKGLGRTESGMTDAIKPKLKFDTAGIGHDRGEQFSFHWWDHVFNKAAKNIAVENRENGVEVKLKRAKENLISNKRSSTHLKQKSLLYGSFVKHGTLKPDGIVSQEMSSSDDSDTDDGPPESYAGNDERLFKACGGRTAHKGARHGLQLSGKLRRIEMQDDLHRKASRLAPSGDSKKSLASEEDGDDGRGRQKNHKGIGGGDQEKHATEEQTGKWAGEERGCAGEVEVSGLATAKRSKKKKRRHKVGCADQVIAPAEREDSSTENGNSAGGSDGAVEKKKRKGVKECGDGEDCRFNAQLRGASTSNTNGSVVEVGRAGASESSPNRKRTKRGKDDTLDERGTNDFELGGLGGKESINEGAGEADSEAVDSERRKRKRSKKSRRKEHVEDQPGSENVECGSVLVSDDGTAATTESSDDRTACEKPARKLKKKKRKNKDEKHFHLTH